MTAERDGMSRRNVLKKGAFTVSAAVIGGAAASGTAAAGIGDGRILDFHLNNLNYDRFKGEVIAGHVHNASSSSIHGEWYDEDVDPVIKDGAIGNAFRFNGGEWFSVPDDSSLRLDGPFTAAAWIRFEESSASPNDYEFFLSKRGSSSGEYQVYYAKDQGQIKYWNGSTIYGINLDLATGTWHHLGWVYDGNDFIAYHDGSEVARTPADPPQTGTSDVYVGKDNVGNYIKADNDEVRLYNRALSPTEMNELATMDDT